MFPLLPFAAGLLTGVAAIKLIRNEKAKKQLDKAQDRLREATVSSLATLEQSSARLRDKLQTAPPAAAPAQDAEAPAAAAKAAKPARKPAAKRKTAAKPKAAAPAGGAA